MRSRSLKPSLFTNELLAIADYSNTVIFTGLWCLADRDGRLEDRPARIHMAINPGRQFEDTDKALGWLAMNGFIARYKVGALALIQVLNFSKHQTPHFKEKASGLPPMDGTSTRGNDSMDKEKAQGEEGMEPPSMAPEPRAGPRPNGHDRSMDGPSAHLTPDSGLLTPDCSPSGGVVAADAAPQPPQAGREGKPRKPKRRGPVEHFVPEDWQVSADDYRWALGQGYAAEFIARETERFCDYEFKSPRSDWTRAWRNWITKDPPGVRHGASSKRVA